jgi:hypothetical protein
VISSSKENNHRQLFSVVPEDYEKLKGYFKLRKPVTCENVITDSYIWKNYYNTKYYINEYGLVWIYRIKNQVFSSVPLCTDENMVASFYEMKEYFNSVLGVKLKLYLVDEHTKNILNLPKDKFLVEEERDYFDYLYNAKELMALSGKKYHKKKNHVNGFLKEYENRYRVKIADKSDVESIKEFLIKWHNKRNIIDEYNRDDYELKGIFYVLEHCDMLKYKMLLVYVDDVIEGFTLGTYLREEKTAYIHVEKANPDIRGLYAFINREFLKNCFSEAEYVNREDDMGLEGLRKAKLSYNPIELIKKYTITEL